MKRSTSRFVFSFIFLLSVRFFIVQASTAQNSTIPVNIGVVLDVDDWVGKIGLSCINLSLSDFYANHSHYKTRLIIYPRNSYRDVIGAPAAALELIKNVEVQAIVESAASMQTDFVIQLGEKAQVPIISCSASSFSLASIRSPYFFRATQSDSHQAQAISAIIKHFGWKEIVAIYVDNVFGQGIIPYLTNALQAIGTRVSYWSAISTLATDDQIVKELRKLKSMESTVFIVHMFPSLGSRFFTKAKELEMMSEGYAWIITDGMTDSLSSPELSSVIDSMQGVLGVKPYVPKSNEMENLRVRWKRKFLQENPDAVDAEMNINGVCAYDAITALAVAIEIAGTLTLGFQMKNVSSNSTTGLENFGVSQNGPNLVQVLSNISFQGVTGNFRFVNGQLQSLLSFQVVNVIDDGTKGVGFWTPGQGLTRKLNSLNNNTGDTADFSSSLASIIWPGDSTSIPKGWEIPTNGRVLRIGVPVKEGFTQFVRVEKNPNTNTSMVSGFCIDIVEAAMKELQFPVHFEFIPYAAPDGKSNGTYDELVFQVYLGNFDAVVGDISIVASRALYVEYTVPYLEYSGLSMIVPTEDHKSRKTWVFFKPLTWEVWMTIFCFFIFIGFVVWVLEHKINEDFQGTASHQIGTTFWFSFSAMVFAHREKVMSNLAKLVVIIWCFVGLVLTQSYAALLSSFLTVQQLQPTVDMNQLKHCRVGYQKDSAVYEQLKALGFDSFQLLPYGSLEECDQLFSKGSKNGGIVAAFDEAPYINIIQSQTCPKYTVVDPKLEFQQFSTNGFGFVFPRGSPLVFEVSTAILVLKESKKIKKIEEKWFKRETNCTAHSDPVPYTLGLDSFIGLFMIAGVASLFALLTYVAMVVHGKIEVYLINRRISTTVGILDLLKIFRKQFIRPQTSSRTFQKDLRAGQQVHFDSAEHVGPSSDGQMLNGSNPNQEILTSIEMIRYST